MYDFKFPDSRGSDIKIDIVMCSLGSVQSTKILHFPKLAICGPGTCGKDTVAEWLARHTILKYLHSTSMTAAPFVFKKMTELGFAYPDIHHCYADRSHHRKLWADLIDEYNADDPARLYREHLHSSDILTGIRKHRELEACKQAGLLNIKIWIEKTLCPPDETLDYGMEACDIIITNNSGKSELYQKLHSFAATLGILKRVT